MSKSDFHIEMDLSKLRSYRADLPDKADQALRASAEDMTTEMKLSFGTGPGDKTYTRGGVTHVASAPGDPPNSDTGSLLNSLHWEGIGYLHYEIRDGVQHGIYMELGTETIEARPFMYPVFERWRQGVFADLLARILG